MFHGYSFDIQLCSRVFILSRSIQSSHLETMKKDYSKKKNTTESFSSGMLHEPSDT